MDDLIKHPGPGRPRRFMVPDQIQTLGDEYFANTPQEKVSITGLCLHLGILRETLCEYEKLPDFADTIKSLKLRVEYAYEMRGDKGAAPPAYTIFALKNMGWKDRFENNSTVTHALSFCDILASIDGGTKGVLPSQQKKIAK